MNNNFYSDTRKQDLYRIPLVEPHELISSGGIGYDWFYKVQYINDTDPDTKELHIEKVGVRDSLLVFYTSSVYIDYKMNRAWYIVDLKKKKMFTYTNFQDYKEFLQGEGIHELALYKADEIYSGFEKSGRLPWKNSPN